MALTHVDGKFLWAGSFEERFIPKEARFRWDPHGTDCGKPKTWWTDDPDKALRLIDYADPETQAILEGKEAEHKQAIEASKATAADIDIPSPEGLEYMPFQKAGIAFAAGREHVLIGDEMGLGKTIQAIGLINLDPTIQRVLVVCPASLRLNWQRELRKWLVNYMTVGIADTKSGWPTGADIVVINYDILEKYHERLRQQEWDMLIVDEAHYLKNPKTVRTTQVLGKWHRDPAKVIEPIPARRKVFLTGTPIVNRPIELWPILRSAEVFKNWKFYVERYCAGMQTRYGWDVKGASNLSELQEKLRSTFMVRRLKKDVLVDLPSKRRQVIELPANGCSGVIAEEKATWERQREIVEELQYAVELAKASDDPQDYENAVKALRVGITTAFNDMAKASYNVAMAKLPYVIEHLKEAIDSSNKVVVFTQHHDVTDALMKEFGAQAVRLDGRDKMEDRQASVDRFQNDPDCHLFVGSIGAAGVGITLTASSHVVFAELDWVPGNLSQAEDRCHRIGQAESVLVQHIVLEESLDATIAQRVVEKQEVIDKALDKDIEINRTPIAPTVTTKTATSDASRERIAKEAEELTAEEIPEIHAKLRYLATLDYDYAREINDIGFNKYDVMIGHELASRDQLTPKQAALGKRIVKKYHRQLDPVFA